jgi:hypothetical protein
MDATARRAVIDKAKFRDAAQLDFAALNAEILDRTDSATRWCFAGHDEIDVLRHDHDSVKGGPLALYPSLDGFGVNFF